MIRLSAGAGILTSMLAGASAAQGPLHELFTEVGDQVQDHFGWSMNSLGDVDGDGYDDFVVGSNPMIPQLTALGPGYLRVYSGRTGLVLFEAEGDAVGDELGISVSGAGDVDADGVPDVIAGASQRYISSLPGYARLFSGQTGQVLWTLAGDPADPLGELFGCGVGGPGDLNGDGFDDVLVGIPGSDSGGMDSGTVRAFSGEWIVSTSKGRMPASPEILYEVSGIPGKGLGCVIATPFFFDQDDVPDFVTSSTGNFVRAYSGADGSLLWSVNSTSGAFDFFGGALDGVGDIDGDGLDEVAIGAYLDPTQGQSGAAWVRSGADGSILATFFGNDPGFAVPTTGLGTAVAGVGDLNGDGVPDVGLGARIGGDAFQGTFDVVSGEWIASTAGGLTPTTSKILLHLEGENAFDWFGFSATGLGDVNADGVPDFGVGAPKFHVPGASDAGALYVFSGAALSMASSDHVVSLAAGGSQTLTLDAPAAEASDFYVILGSASGTKPGIMLDGLPLPLNLDAYTTTVAQLANQTPFLGFADFLDGSGDGTASFTIPPGLDPSLAGVTLDHAFVAIDLFPVPAVKFISNPVPVSFVP